ncbi:uncharacterized protein LOC103711985 isoform X2 [Phoenix dactylifera]|uniref:Uncharacterized protein LOC103711985 isoform X2 n=1 Tax=Phoenix dactylifera TaxID=42345 RepID=A0A8B7CCY4_PHODC|nr:uncharacterized protein LOC103711985 isoform X2 [Phoenix dactylifera]
MALRVHPTSLTSPFLLPSPCSHSNLSKIPHFQTLSLKSRSFRSRKLKALPRGLRSPTITAALPPLDLNEDNIRQVLIDARSEFAQIFDSSVGITGEVDLAELDGPFVKLRLQGRFWHQRAIVLARLGNYLKNRIPEILEVDIEDERQLDDSPENF